VYQLQFGCTDCIIQNADPITFEFISADNWAKDKNYVFYELEKLNEVNSKDFIVIDKDWGKDNNFYYYHNLRLNSLDYKTAEIISSYYIKDKSNVFYRATLVKNADPKTFKVDGAGSFGHDNKYIFSGDQNEGLITEQYRKTYIDNK
jgi:DKNYY family